MKVGWMSALLIVALVGWIGTVAAQQQAPTQAPAAPAAPAAAAEKQMEGKVKAIDQAKKQVTLEDGTTLTVPAGVQIRWAEVKPGATVMISYVETGREKTVRKLEVKG